MVRYYYLVMGVQITLQTRITYCELQDFKATLLLFILYHTFYPSTTRKSNLFSYHTYTFNFVRKKRLTQSQQFGL